MLLTPPSLTLIFRQRLDRVWGVVLCTFFICTHCVAIPSTVSPTRLTSAVEQRYTCHGSQRGAAASGPHVDCTLQCSATAAAPGTCLQPVCGRGWQVEGQSSRPNPALPGTWACLTLIRTGSWRHISHHPFVNRGPGWGEQKPARTEASSFFRRNDTSC